MFDVKNITMIYDVDKENKMYALGGFDLSLPDKGLIGFIGPSGSGKSTLMYCLSTLKKPTAGEIVYNGRNLVHLKETEREHLRRQLVAIGRAMINEPRVLFADEPTAALDHETAFSVMGVLREYAREHLVLVITHDITILKDADHVIEIWDGMIGTKRGGGKN